MKRISKILLFATGIFSVLLSIPKVEAATLSYDETKYYWERKDAEHHGSGVLKNYYVNGRVAYCIEPRVHEGTDNYKEGTWEDIDLDDDIKEQILLISFYGYTYDGHQTLKYRAATQAAIKNGGQS